MSEKSGKLPDNDESNVTILVRKELLRLLQNEYKDVAQQSIDSLLNTQQAEIDKLKAETKAIEEQHAKILGDNTAIIAELQTKVKRRDMLITALVTAVTLIIIDYFGLHRGIINKTYDMIKREVEFEIELNKKK